MQTLSIAMAFDFRSRDGFGPEEREKQQETVGGFG
jgi:hypothetical protein